MTKNDTSVVLIKIRQLLKLTDFLFKSTFSSPFSMILLLGTWWFNILLPVFQVFNFEYENNVSVNCAVTSIFTVSIFFIWNMLYQTQSKTERAGSAKLLLIRPISREWLFLFYATGYSIILAVFLFPLSLTPVIAERVSEHLITNQGSPYYFKDIITASIFCSLPVISFIAALLVRRGVSSFIFLFNTLALAAFIIFAIILKDSFKLNLLVSSALIAAVSLIFLAISEAAIIISESRLIKIIIPATFIVGFFFYPICSKFIFCRIVIPPYGQALNFAITSPTLSDITPYIFYSLAYITGITAIKLITLQSKS